MDVGDLDEDDPIDAVALAWMRELPGTPVDGIPVISRILRLAGLLCDDRRRVLARAGSDWATLDLLSVLRRSGPPYRLTTRQITRRTLVTAGAVSQRLARAEADGLVRRAPVADGSRTVQVTLTPKGRELNELLVDAVLSREHEIVSGLSLEERARLADSLRGMLAVVEQHLDADGSAGPKS